MTRRVLALAAALAVLCGGGAVLAMRPADTVPGPSSSGGIAGADLPAPASAIATNERTAGSATVTATVTASTAATPAATPRSSSAEVNTAPLPSCAIDDVETPLTSYGDWRLTLVDRGYAVPAGYAPTDLVDSARAGIHGGIVRAIVVPDLQALYSAALHDGIKLQIASGYRDYRTQEQTFRYWLNVLGDEAYRSSARPGHSEHQLGTAIDFQEAGGQLPWTYYSFYRDTAAGRWLAVSSWRYGFVESYPYGKDKLTCYGFEPWHFRYVGREEAAAIRASGLTMRQWLWLRQPDQSGSRIPGVSYALPTLVPPGAN